MERVGKILEFLSASGEVLFKIHVSERTIGFQSDQGGKKGKENGGNGKSSSSNSLMTDAQKRFLFRILAEQGIEGELLTLN